MDYENNSYEEKEQREVNERRQKKVQNFHLHIKDDDLAVGENYLEHDNYDDESHKTLNSFSGDDVREQMERNSRHLRKREKREEESAARDLKYHEERMKREKEQAEHEREYHEKRMKSLE
jgi:hypothetical protein